MSVPPLRQRILHPGEGRIALRPEDRRRDRQIVDDVEHRDGEDEAQVKQVGDVDMQLVAVEERNDEEEEINDTDERKTEEVSGGKAAESAQRITKATIRNKKNKKKT